MSEGRNFCGTVLVPLKGPYDLGDLPTSMGRPGEHLSTMKDPQDQLTCEEVAILHLMVFRLVQIQAHPGRFGCFSCLVTLQATAEFDSGDAPDALKAQRILDAAGF